MGERFSGRPHRQRGGWLQVPQTLRSYNGVNFGLEINNTMIEMSYFLPGVFLIYGVFLLQNAAPGPNVLAVIGTSMAVGRLAGLAVSFGVASGTLTWSTASVLGLSAIIASYGELLFYIKIAGGCYLLYLAYRALRSAWSIADLDAPSSAKKNRTLLSFYRKGYFLNLTNPKAALGWIAIVSLGLEPGAPTWVSLAIIFGTTMLSLGVHIIYTFVFSTPGMIAVYAKARRPVQAALGSLFSFAGYKLLTAEID